MAKKLDSTYVPKPGESKGSTAASLSRVLMAIEKKNAGKLGAGISNCTVKGMHD